MSYTIIENLKNTQIQITHFSKTSITLVEYNIVPMIDISFQLNSLKLVKILGNFNDVSFWHSPFY